MIKKGLLKERQENKALKALNRDDPRFTTTEALRLINAKCGAAKFHKILQSRKLAMPVETGEKGYNFDLPSKYGGGTFSMNHHSFCWTIIGVEFMSKILLSEDIAFNMPQKLTGKLKVAVHKKAKGGII